MKPHYDLAVVGAGVIGTFHAYHALQRGKSVVLLERDQQPNEATVRNFGQIVPSGMSSQWFPRGRRAAEIYRHLQSQTDLTLRENGSIYIASDEEEMAVLEETHALFQGRDYPSELWTAAQVREHLPPVRPDYPVGALYFPQEFSVEPRQMIHRLLAWLSQDERLDYRPHTTVREVADTGSRVMLVTNSGAKITADRAVVASGREFKILFPEIFQASDLKVSKLQMMLTKPLPNVQLPGNILTGLSIRRYESFREVAAYEQLTDKPEHAEYKKWGIHILFKQRPDGSIILGDSHEYASAATTDALDFGVNLELNDLMLKEIRRIVDLPDWSIVNAWNGYYSQTSDGNHFERWLSDRLVILTGIGGKGMSCGAGIAEEMIEKLF